MEGLFCARGHSLLLEEVERHSSPSPRSTPRWGAHAPHFSTLPRGGFVKKLAQELNVTRDFPAHILSKLKNRPTGVSDARVTACSDAANKGEVMAVVTKWFKTVDEEMFEAVDGRVLRNYGRVSTAAISTAGRASEVRVVGLEQREYFP